MDILYTENLTLREFRISDSERFYLNNRDEQIRKYMPFRAYSDENSAKKALEDLIGHYRPESFPYYLAVVKTDADKLIGHIGIGDWDISETERANELEYAIFDGYRGFHFAAEALRAFAPWCKKEFHLERVYALVDRQNIPSCKTLAAAGFTLAERKFKNRKETTEVYVF
jgi:RimJ/RimL family protein N-acetyltransferase